MRGRAFPDEESFDLDSLDAAEHEATQAPIQLGQHWLACAHEVSIQVTHERSKLVPALSIAARIEWTEHLSRLP